MRRPLGIGACLVAVTSAALVLLHGSDAGGAASPLTAGAALGGALVLCGAALLVAGRRVVVQKTAVEERPPLADRSARAEAAATVASAAEGVSRRRLIVAAGGAAGTALAAAGVAPLLSLGSSDAGVGDSPWRDGTALVDEHGRAIVAAEVEEGSFATAYPAGADPRELGSPVLAVRIPPDQVRLPPERRGWAPAGILAYSKVCTHAGCAVSMLRYPLYPAHAPEPAVVCPCHYSTFAVAEGGSVVFGPAGRALPQLPLRIAPDGTLIAAGRMSGPIGPGWWGVRQA